MLKKAISFVSSTKSSTYAMVRVRFVAAAAALLMTVLSIPTMLLERLENLYRVLCLVVMVRLTGFEPVALSSGG
jgi:hypothetical protein